MTLSSPQPPSTSEGFNINNVPDSCFHIPSFVRYHASSGVGLLTRTLLRAVTSVTMANQNVEENGLLSEHPLAELIREAGAVSLSGAFRLSQNRVKSVVYFDAGELTFAVSNVRTNRLSESARKWNFVNEHQLNAVGTHSSDVKLGAALVESGALTAEKLGELLSLQTASVLRPMLLWIDGTWSFDPRVRLAEDISVQMDLRPVLMESARRLPPDFVVKRFDTTNEMLSVAIDPPLEPALQPIEAFLLSRIDATGIRLRDLLAISGLPEVQTLGTLYPLVLGGFLDRDRWPRAFPDDVVGRFRAVDEAVRKREKESPKPEVAAPEKVTVKTAKATDAPAPKIDEQQEINQFVSRVESADNFYEVLAVTQSADASTIKRTYHALARSFHPDRFHKEAGTPFHARLQSTFARVAQAYEMLRDSTLRASYDLRLQTEKRMRRPGSISPKERKMRERAQQDSRTHAPGTEGPAPSNKTIQAEEIFQRGMSALKAGNMSLAVALLAEASRREPNEPRYRAYYGLSLSSNKQMRHKAEAELQAAISLDTNNVLYRVMLAELYCEYGMMRRAQAEAQRALVIDPKNTEAIRLLEQLSLKG